MTGCSRPSSTITATEEYYHSKDPENDLWRTGMTPAQARFMRFAEELIYTAGFDTQHQGAVAERLERHQNRRRTLMCLEH